MAIGHINIDVDTKTRRFGPIMYVRGLSSHRGGKPMKHRWLGARVPFVGVVVLSVGRGSIRVTLERT